MLNPYINRELNPNMTKRQMMDEYADVVKNIYKHLAEIEQSNLWKVLTLNQELLELYRINYSNNGDVKNIKAIEKVEREVYDTIEQFRELKKIADKL